jgi:hypothetical protein
VGYYHPSSKDQNVIPTYLGWDTKWVSNGQSSQHMGQFGQIQIPCFCAWKPQKDSRSEIMIIPKKHIKFARDNLAHILVAKNHVKNEIED